MQHLTTCIHPVGYDKLTFTEPCPRSMHSKIASVVLRWLQNLFDGEEPEEDEMVMLHNLYQVSVSGWFSPAVKTIKKSDLSAKLFLFQKYLEDPNNHDEEGCIRGAINQMRNEIEERKYRSGGTVEGNLSQGNVGDRCRS